MRSLVLLILTSLLLHSLVLAQAPRTQPAASVLFIAPSGPLRAMGLVEPDSLKRDIRPTHWKEGALVGGLIGAVGGALLSRAFCSMSEDSSCSTVPGIVVGAVLLALPGALIGGQFPKGDREDQRGDGS